MSRGVPALVVGAGLMGRWHAHALRRAGGFVAGVVDPDGARASELAGRSAPVFAELARALEETGTTVAHVCTPLQSHLHIARTLLEARVHVIMEKPLTDAAPETLELLRLADQHGVLLCPVHQFPFQSGFRRVVEETGAAGAILHVDYVAASAGADEPGTGSAEDVARDILPHPLSLFRRLVGGDFDSTAWSVPGGPPGEFRAMGTCRETSLGVLITMRGRPTRNSLRVVCERATFSVDLFHGFAVRDSCPVSRRSKVLRPFRLAGRSGFAASMNLAARAIRSEPAYPGLRDLVRRFYQAVDGAGPPPYSHDEIHDVAVARDRLVAQRDR